MSSFDELEDDLLAPATNNTAALFADDDDDDIQAPAAPPAQQQFDDSDDEDLVPRTQPGQEPAEAGPGSASAASAGPTDIKSKLAALAEKKRREAEAAANGEGRKRKSDKGDGDAAVSGKKRKKDKSGKGSKSDKKTRRSARGQQEDGEGGSNRPRAARTGGEDGPQGSVDSAELKASADDTEFIDDEVDGEEEEDEIGSDVADDEELAPQGPPPEALEVDEAEDADMAAFGRPKKKKSHESEAQMGDYVNRMVGKMESMAEEDMEQRKARRPALNKLKMLSEVETFLAQRKYHDLFIANGGLGVLKAWLEPYANGDLPNVKIRAAILSACKRLPIDLGMDGMRDLLKKSQLGTRVLFLAHCPDETDANRKLAADLVREWARPLYLDGEIEARKREQRAAELTRARLQMQQQTREREAAAAAQQAEKSKIKFGQAGYRWHAAIPQTSKLDYVVQPQADEALATAAASMQTSSKKDSGLLTKKMREVVRKQKESTARAAVPSVEGRGMVLMH